MRTIKTVGVVGAGTMGAAITQKFAQEGFKVLLADREMQFVNRGLGNISKMLGEGIERKVFTQAQVDGYLNNITGTANLTDLKACDLVVEAIFEDFNAKCDLFKQLSAVLDSDTIIATNTSSYSVTELAESVSHPERFIGLHYFYHAAKNRLVEIIPGEKTSDEVIESAKTFSMLSGKDAISCRDAYGFVVNRFFVPWLNESVRLLQEKIANIATIDAVCMELFGIGMGPFALMNATGVPVAYHAEKTLERLGPLYSVAYKLKEQALSGNQWDLEGDVYPDPAIKEHITKRMLGVVFVVCSQLLDEKVCQAVDINRGAKIGLKWRKGPIDLMLGMKEDLVWAYIHNTASLYQMAMPVAVGAEHWKMNFVDLNKKGEIAIITMNRPEDLNALNEEVVQQLDEKFSDANSDPAIKTIFLTGAGKAFVAGADIKYFIKKIKAERIGDIETFTAYGQQVFSKIDKSKKKVVAVINGLALGGGLELALCADVLVAMPKAMMAFPETGIGIYPGLGGTQRSAWRTGKALARYLVLSGKMLTAGDALGVGLIDAIVTPEEGAEMLAGKIPAPDRKTTEPAGTWKNYDAFFKANSTADIMAGKTTGTALREDEAAKIVKTFKRKAPVAMALADQLIEDGSGPESELSYLNKIFKTSDALLGLSNIGKQVEYQGK